MRETHHSAEISHEGLPFSFRGEQVRGTYAAQYVEIQLKRLRE